MKFCPACGAELQLKIPDGDRIERFVCSACKQVHYQNPRILVTCLATWEKQALWMKRAHPPAVGGWSVPGGYLEKGESLQEAAVRELYEETRAVLAPEDLYLYGIGTIRHVNQVYVSFRARLRTLDFAPTEEASEVALFSAETLPWEQLAFPLLIPAIRNFYRELLDGEFKVYLGDYQQDSSLLREA